MSSSNAPLPNDPYAWIDRYAADLHRAARDLARDGEASRVSDEAVAQLLTAAIRLYYMKADVEERTFSPVIREQTDPLTATEVLSRRWVTISRPSLSFNLRVRLRSISAPWIRASCPAL